MSYLYHSLSKKTKDVIKSIDLFNEPVSLHLFGKKKYSTLTGTFFSIIMIAILIFLSFSKFSSLLTRKNVSIQNYDKINTVPPLLNLKNRFAFNLDPYILNSLKGKRYLDFFFLIGRVFYYSNGTESRTKTYLNISKCEPKDFPMFSEEQLISFGFADWLCPDFSYEDFNVIGKYYDPLYQYLQIGIKECSNSSNRFDGDFCASDNEVSEIRKKNSGKLYVNFKIINNLVNLNNYYEEIFHPFVDPMDYLISNKDSFIQREIYFTRSDVETDETRSFNFFRDENNYKNDSGFVFERKFDEFRLNENTTSGGSKIYTSIYLRSGQKSIIIKRQYENFQDFLQGFGALYSILFIFFKILSGIMTKDIMTQKIANSLYNFSDIPLFGKKIKTKTDKGSEMENSISKFKNSFFMRLKEFFWRKKKKDKNTYTVKEISNTVTKDMDLIEILHKMKQFENFKTIILNKDQKILLDFSAKPKFKIDSSNMTKKEVLNQVKKLKTKHSKRVSSIPNLYNLVQKAYRNILSDRNNSINQKILEILDFEFINKLDGISSLENSKMKLSFPSDSKFMEYKEKF